MKRNCVWFVICLALLAWAASDVKAQTRWNSGPTIKIQNMTFPAYSREYLQLKSQIEAIENKLRLAGSSEIKENDQDQRPTWNSLSERTQNYLIEKFNENPNLRVYDVRDLCPAEISYKDFANIINAYKEKTDLEDKLEELQVEQGIQLESHFFGIVDKIFSKHPDYNTIDAEFPFDDLVPAISDLYGYFKSYNEDLLGEELVEEELFNEKEFFDLCEGMWETERPCIANCEPAKIALKFWTAFMRGNYNEAIKYTDEEMANFIMKVKSNPEIREKCPINPNFVGYVSCVMPGFSIEEEDKKDKVGLLENKEIRVSITPGKIEYTEYGLRKGPTEPFEDLESQTRKGDVTISMTKNENGMWVVGMQTIFYDNK